MQLNVIRNPDFKLYAAIKMGIAAMKTDRDLAERLYQLAKGIYDQSKHDRYNSFQYYEGLGRFNDIGLRLIALAGLIHKTADVDAFLTIGMHSARRRPPINGLSPSRLWRRQAALTWSLSTRLPMCSPINRHR